MFSEKEGNLDTRKTQRKIPWEDRDRDWSDASISQRIPRIVGNNEMLEEARKDPPTEPLEGMLALLNP